MIELAVVILILGIFTFPLHATAGCLGLYTTWFIFGCYESFKNQPLEGKRIQSIAQIAFFINFIASLVLGSLLAMMVYIFIFDFYYLFIFNLIFCFLISIRWFDFSYKFFHHFTFRNENFRANEKQFFVVCRGFKNKSSLGMSPAFIDAGYLILDDNHAIFEGTFFKKIFSPKIIRQIDKKSSEKLKILTHPINCKEPDIFLISLKNQFYPFRSRSDRDSVIERLAPQIADKQI